MNKIKDNKDWKISIDDMQLMIGALQALIPVAAVNTDAAAPVAAAGAVSAVPVLIKWLSEKEKVINFGQRIMEIIQSHKARDDNDQIEKISRKVHLTKPS